MDNKNKPSKIMLSLCICFVAVAILLAFLPIPNKEFFIMIIGTIGVVCGMIFNSIRVKNSSAVKRTFNAVHVAFVFFVIVIMFIIVLMSR